MEIMLGVILDSYTYFIIVPCALSHPGAIIVQAEVLAFQWCPEISNFEEYKLSQVTKQASWFVTYKIKSPNKDKVKKGMRGKC